MSCFNTASGMRSHVTREVVRPWAGMDAVSIPQAVWDHMWLQQVGSNGGDMSSFNTASGMRSHVTTMLVSDSDTNGTRFQYRKRYEITCDVQRHRGVVRGLCVSIPQAVWDHMWPMFSTLPRRRLSGFNTASGMRSHVTSRAKASTDDVCSRFNTASGMRSHVTAVRDTLKEVYSKFQYRKRYEITCDLVAYDWGKKNLPTFQYRKRYEITCDYTTAVFILGSLSFQYRKRYENTCDKALVNDVENE